MFVGTLKTTKGSGAKLVRRLRILPQREINWTDNCIQSRSSKKPFFCFEEKAEKGEMTIKDSRS